MCPPPHKQGPSLVSCKVTAVLGRMEILRRKWEGEAEICWEPECKNNLPKGHLREGGGFEFGSSTTWTDALTTEFMHKMEYTVTSRFAVGGGEMNFDSKCRTGWETPVWAPWWQSHALKAIVLKSWATYIFQETNQKSVLCRHYHRSFSLQPNTIRHVQYLCFPHPDCSCCLWQ